MISPVRASSVLNRSGIPGMDYAINPYTGCAHGCVYCYASFMKRFTGHAEPWGTFVDVKMNAPDVLARQLKRPRCGTVIMSSVTDPYQPAETDFQITRRLLETLSGHDGLRISILTKSDLVLRDLDLLRKLPGLEVGFTITALDDRVAGWIEPGAPPPSRRLMALEKVSKAGVPTKVLLAPLLPGISDTPRALKTTLEALAVAGADRILVDRFNPYPSAVRRLGLVLAQKLPGALKPFRRSLQKDAEYAEELRSLVSSVIGSGSYPAALLF